MHKLHRRQAGWLTSESSTVLQRAHTMCSWSSSPSESKASSGMRASPSLASHRRTHSRMAALHFATCTARAPACCKPLRAVSRSVAQHAPPERSSLPSKLLAAMHACICASVGNAQQQQRVCAEAAAKLQGHNTERAQHLLSCACQLRMRLDRLALQAIEAFRLVCAQAVLLLPAAPCTSADARGLWLQLSSAASMAQKDSLL